MSMGCSIKFFATRVTNATVPFDFDADQDPGSALEIK